MKVRTRIIYLAIMIPVCYAYGQPDFESLNLTSAPSFILLGVEPENVTRPTSPKQFVGGLQNAFINGKVQPNFAMEFTPYYFKNPETNEGRFKSEIVFPDSNIFRNAYKTLSVSIGTSESDTTIFGNLDPGTGLGFGVRFTLIEGKPKLERFRDLLEWNEVFIKLGALREASTTFALVETPEGALHQTETIDANFKKHLATYPSYNFLGGQRGEQAIRILLSEIENEIKENGLPAAREFVERKITEYDSLERLILQKINDKKYPFAKQGFMLEVAMGEALVFQNNHWNEATHAKSAIWLTPSYRWDVSKDNKAISLVDIVGVLRFTFNNKEDSVDVSDYVDVGLKTKYMHNRWSFSMEGVYRYASDVNTEEVRRKYTYRISGTLDYKINDLISFKATFGTSFNGNTATYSDPKEIFALGGINIGLFNGTK
ncbi:MAG TPA: hypothetical protein VFW11_23220 [Cyclobacteriaceae bacterium]|nr:hypothetical protein [Cyclobacteriaceae bacterium]